MEPEAMPDEMRYYEPTLSARCRFRTPSNDALIAASFNGLLYEGDHTGKEDRMAVTMTRPERESFLAGVHVGMISIAEEGRGPLTVPVWYAYEPGGEVRVAIGKHSRKGRLLTQAG